MIWKVPSINLIVPVAIIFGGFVATGAMLDYMKRKEDAKFAERERNERTPGPENKNKRKKSVFRHINDDIVSTF